MPSHILSVGAPTTINPVAQPTAPTHQDGLVWTNTSASAVSGVPGGHVAASVGGVWKLLNQSTAWAAADTTNLVLANNVVTTVPFNSSQTSTSWGTWSGNTDLAVPAGEYLVSAVAYLEMNLAGSSNGHNFALYLTDTSNVAVHPLATLGDFSAAGVQTLTLAGAYSVHVTLAAASYRLRALCVANANFSSASLRNNIAPSFAAKLSFTKLA